MVPAYELSPAMLHEIVLGRVGHPLPRTLGGTAQRIVKRIDVTVAYLRLGSNFLVECRIYPSVKHLRLGLLASAYSSTSFTLSRRCQFTARWGFQGPLGWQTGPEYSMVWLSTLVSKVRGPEQTSVALAITTGRLTSTNLQHPSLSGRDVGHSSIFGSVQVHKALFCIAKHTWTRQR